MSDGWQSALKRWLDFFTSELTNDNTATAALRPKILNLVAVDRTGMTGDLAVRRSVAGGGERIESHKYKFAILDTAAIQ